MESRQRIGLYGSGDVPRSKRLTSKAVGPKSNGLRFLGDLPPVRRVRPTRISTKGIAAAAIAPLAVIMMIVVAFAVASSWAPVQELKTEAKAPPPPYTCAGYVYQTDGVTPVLGATVKVTNLRTGLFATTTTDTEFGIYQADLVPLSGDANPLPGDQILVEASFPPSSAGSAQGVIPSPIGGMILIDVTFGTFIPELSSLVLPIVGMLGMFVMVVAVTRSKKS